MASLANFRPLHSRSPCRFLDKTDLNRAFNVGFHPIQIKNLPPKLLVSEAKAKRRASTKTLDAKTLNRKMRKKYNGTATKPRLSVFCSEKQLYAMLVDDQNKKCLFYASTLQKIIRTDPNVSAKDAARVVGEELVKAAVKLNINEISSYDSNGCARRGLCGERIKAFEIAISSHGFLPW